MVLILFTESLDVRFTVGIEEFLAALLPRLFGLGRCDVPVRPTFPGQGTQVLAEIFHSGPAEEPVAVVVGCAEATLVNGIHTPTVVSILTMQSGKAQSLYVFEHSQAVTAGLAKLAQARIKEAAAPKSKAD
jgi:hypothetical protein